MKAILEFTLPEEEAEYYVSARGGQYALLLSEFMDEVRNVAKYDAKFCKLKPAQCEELREWFAERFKERSLEWP